MRGSPKMHNRLTAIAVLLLSPIVGLYAQPQTSPATARTPVSLTEFFGLTTSTTIDNRSPTTRFNNIHLIQASGTGTWSVQLQYATASTGPWTNFSDPTSVLSNTSATSTGGAYGYHPFIRLLIAGTATVNYSGTQNLYVPFGGGGGGGGGGPLLQTNNSTNINQNLLNVLSGTYQGLTITAANPSGGVLQLGLSGTLNNAGLTNPSISVVVPSWLTAAPSPVSLGGTLTISPTAGQTAGRVIGTCGAATTVAPCQLAASDITLALASSTSINGSTVPASQTLLYAGGPLGTPLNGVGTNLTGIPLSTGILATFSPPLQLSGNTLSGPTIVTATSPGVGIAHFAGATQAVTSSAVNLASADVTGVLGAANLPTATNAAKGIVQGDGSTITIAAGIESCTTATTGQLGCVKPDGTTITIAAGVITANITGMTIGGSISGGTPGNVLYVGAGPVLAQETTLGAARFPALGGDVRTSAGSLTATVQGFNAVPFCTGFSLTAGVTWEYTVTSSPNPCWTPFTITGGGNVSTSGSPTQFQIAAFASSTTIQGITPPAGAGVPLLSGGTGFYPAFGPLNLAGGSAIVNGVTPSVNGGTGVNNGGSTITIGGNVTVAGAFTLGITLTGNTAITLPTSGILGTVTSVGFTGGIVSVATATTTPAFTVAGTSGGVPCFNSPTSWQSSALMVSGQFMLGGGAGNCPSTSFSIVPMASGGSNANLTPSVGGLVYSTSSALAILAGTATANQIPMSGASAPPTWSTATYPPTTTVSQLLYSSATNVVSGLGTCNNGVIVTGGTGTPSCSTTLPTGLAMGTPASINLTNGTNYPLATGSTFGIVKPDNTTVTIVGGVLSSVGGGGGASNFTLQNAGTPGTTAGTLTKAPAGLAVIAATTDTNGIVGITTAGAGTTGNATVTYAGNVSCLFDGGTTAGHYVIPSTSVAGDCSDGGATVPVGVQTIGRIPTTNASAGTYTMNLFPPSTPPLIFGTGIVGASGTGGITATLDTTNPGGALSNSAAQSGANQRCNGSASGSAPTCAPTGIWGTYVNLAGIPNGTPMIFTPSTATTSGVQVNVNSLGLATLKQPGGATNVGVLAVGHSYPFVWDSSGSTWDQQDGAWSSINAITGLTGDGTAAGPGSVAFTLATVNSGPGSCGDATHVCQITTIGKGLVTVQSSVAITGIVPSFPVTVAGTVTSGGIPYFNSTTQESSSALLALGHMVAGGGAGGAPTSVANVDYGQTTAFTLTVAGAGGIAVPNGGICISSGPCTIVSGSGAAFGPYGNEGSAPTLNFPAVGVDGCWDDSTAHAPKCSFNNDTAQQLSRESNTTTTTTQVLHATAQAGVGAYSAIATSDLPAIPLTGLAAQAANTVVANVTSGSAAPTAATLPSCSTAASALQYTNGTGFGCATNEVINNGSNTGTSSMTLDLSAISLTAGFKLPIGAGAAPTVDGIESFNTTTHARAWGSNGTTIVGAAAATGTNTATTCTNQVVTVISSVAAPTCSTITSAYASGNTSGSGNFALVNSPGLTGTPTAPTQALGDNSTAIATDAFVLANIAAQVEMHDAVQAATTTALINSPTYSNGSSGVGATLTATVVGVLIIDGYTPVLGDRLLVKNQASTFQNGCYTVTTLGVVGTVDYVLTRCTDFNQIGNIDYGDTFPVLQGTTNANQQFTMNNNAAITVGTTAITFAQTSGGSQLAAGSGITLTGNSIALTVPVTVALGGTNCTTASITCFNNITGYTASGATGTTSTNLVFSTSPTLVTPALGTPSALVCTNCSGTAASLTAGLATNIVGGTAGQSPYQTGASTTSFLGPGTAKQVRVSGGTSGDTYIDFPERLQIPAANCNNATAGAGWSIGASGTVTCRAGTNNLGGFIAITDTSSSFAQFQLSIPVDWDSATRPYILMAFQSATDTTSGHTVIPEVAVSCTTAVNGTASDDITLSAYQSLTTVTFGGSAVAHGFYTTSVQFGSTQMTGCIAGGSMIVSVGRATDTATGVIGFYYADMTFPRLLVVQAN